MMRVRRLAPSLFLAALASSYAGAAAPDPAALRARVRSWRIAHQAEILREFMGLLAIPNVSSDTPNIERNALAIGLMLEKRGLRVQMLGAEHGAPVVFGELKVPGAKRTIAIYAHYDGQPVDPAQWTGRPFEPVLRDKPLEDGGREVSLGPSGSGSIEGEWRLYARGSSDDKAPIVGVLAAVDALAAAKVAPSVNLKVFFEGEEEAGSPHLAEILREHAATLRADLWLLCDGPVHQSRQMQVFFGARGVTGVEITVYGPTRTLHSGHYGNWAPNPALVLAHLVASLRDADGRILVPGFYDDVRPPTVAEKVALAGVPKVDDDLRRSLGLAATEADGALLVERILLPALNVRGLAAGHVGEAAANAIPTEAQASLDFRMVPDQTPQRIRERVEAFLRQQGYFIVHETPGLETRRAHPRIVKLEWGSGYPAARTPLDLPVSRAVLRVVEEGRGQPVLALPTLGGSIPMHLFAEILKAPIIGVPIANHDNNQHAANENIRLQNLWDGIEVYAALLALLGDELDAASGSTTGRATVVPSPYVGRDRVGGR
jgi:acetylornithine deacetylase/succinyl-diaminopimelate desuccinylase-like protein